MNVIMLSGDNQRTANAIAARLGLEARGELLPDAKLAEIDRLKKAGAIAMECVGVLGDASPFDAARGYMVVAEVFEELGQRDKAREIYELAAEILNPLPSRYVVEVYQKLAALLEEDGRKDEALEVLKKAVSVQAEPAR